MNDVARAQAAAYGKYATSNVMKGSPTINLKQGNSNRNINMNTNHARSKNIMMLDNRQVRDKTTALYDPKSIESSYNYLMRGDNSMLQKMQQDGRKKIEFLNEDLLPDYNPKYNLTTGLSSSSSSTLESYYPKLSTSAFNHPPADMKPTLLDNRMRQHTTDREYAWGDDQENLQRNILKDPRRWDRIQRQNESDRRLYRMGVGTDRWDENKNAYSKKQAIRPEFLMDDLKKRINDQRKYDDIDDENLIRSIQRASLAPLSAFETADDTNQQHHGQSGNNNFLQTRYMNKYDYTYTEPGASIERKTIFSTVIDTIKKIFSKTDNMSEESHRKRETNFKYQNTEAFDADITTSRIRNDTVFAVRDGNIFTIAPDNYDVYGSTFVSPISKMMAILNNGQLHIVQKMQSDRILGSDARPVGDDLIVTVLPKSVTEKMKHRLHKSEGRMIQEMNAEDFEELLEFIENNPSVQRRASQSSIMKMLGDNAIDKSMLGEFRGQDTLVQDSMLDSFKSSYVRSGIDMNKDTFRMREEFDDDDVYFDSKQVAIPRGEMHEHVDRRAATFTNRNVIEEANDLMPNRMNSSYRSSEYKTAPRMISTGKSFSDMM